MQETMCKLGPVSFSNSVGYPTKERAPNLWNLGDVNSNTSADFRRRLLAWAELLESDLVAEHWMYESWGNAVKHSAHKNGPIICSESLSCGTVACAGGWLFAVPEVHAHPSNLKETFCESPDAFGLTFPEMAYITYAENHHFPDGPVLTMTDHIGDDGVFRKTSSPKEVAAAIRWLADHKYPEAKPKAKRSAKPYSMRWIAEKLREAAKLIEVHGWTQGRLFRAVDGEVCMCAHGGISAASIKKGNSYLYDFWSGNGTTAAAAAGAAAAASSSAAASAHHAAMPTASWDSVTAMRLCPSYLTKDEHKQSWLVHVAAWYGGCDYVFNDATDRTKDEVLAKLREIAWRFDHGMRPITERRIKSQGKRNRRPSK